MKFILFFLYLNFSFAGTITDQQIDTIYKICVDNNIPQIELNKYLWKEYRKFSIIHLTEKQANYIIKKIVNDIIKKSHNLKDQNKDFADSLLISIGEILEKDNSNEYSTWFYENGINSEEFYIDYFNEFTYKDIAVEVLNGKTKNGKELSSLEIKAIKLFLNGGSDLSLKENLSIAIKKHQCYVESENSFLENLRRFYFWPSLDKKASWFKTNCEIAFSNNYTYEDIGLEIISGKTKNGKELSKLEKNALESFLNGKVKNGSYKKHLSSAMKKHECYMKNSILQIEKKRGFSKWPNLKDRVSWFDINCDKVYNSIVEIKETNQLESSSDNLLYDPMSGKISKENNSNKKYESNIIYDPITGESLFKKNQNKKYLEPKKKWFSSIGFGPSLTNNIKKTKNISANSNTAINFSLYRNYNTNTLVGLNLNGKYQENGRENNLFIHVLSFSYLTFIKNKIQDIFVTVNLGPARSTYNDLLNGKISLQHGYSFMYGIGIPVFLNETILTFGIEYSRLSLKNRTDDYNFIEKNYFIALKGSFLF